MEYPKSRQEAAMSPGVKEMMEGYDTISFDKDMEKDEFFTREESQAPSLTEEQGEGSAEQGPSRKTFLNAGPSKYFSSFFGPRKNMYDFLLTFNIFLAVLHLVLAIGFGIFFYNKFRCNSDKSYFDLDLYTHSQKCFSERRTCMSDRTIAYLAVSFFAVTAIAHLIYAANFRGFYTRDVAAGGMRWRWVEYSISATIMIAIIASLSGVKNLYAYILILIAIFAVMFTGLWFETGGGVIAIGIGFLLLLTVFVVIYSSFLDRRRDAEEGGEQVPGWIQWMLIVIFIFYGVFGLVPIAQLIFGGPFIYYETVYLILSAASKATLASFLAYGFHKRSQILAEE